MAELLFELIGPAIEEPVEAFACGAPWTAHASDEELRRLGTVHARITRRLRGLKDLRAERALIMNRCIRRMRRAEGKD